MAHKSCKIGNFSFLKIVLYFLINKVQVIIRVHHFAIFNYRKNVVFVYVNNLISCMFQTTLDQNKSDKIIYYQ